MDAEHRCRGYLDRLPLDAARRDVIERACAAAGPSPEGEMAALHRALAGSGTMGDAPAAASLEARLALAGVSGRRDPLIVADPRRGFRLLSAPRLNRTSMAPERFPPRAWWPFRRHRPASTGHHREGGPVPNQRGAPWFRASAIRRTTLLILVLVQTWFATNYMVSVLPYHGKTAMEVAVLVLFAILILWVSAGFWTALAGFWLLMVGRDRYSIAAGVAADAPLADGARTAVVMPICNEDVPRVFAGLRATYESLVATGRLDHFDFFVLSDTDEPDTRVAEREAWLDLCHAVDGFGHVFYRRRQHRIKRKSGNIADFCRRWGRSYAYMIVLDADSVMTGDCLVGLARLMDANPSAGIIQTAPRAAGRDTLYARIQQFATRAYGPLFVAGLHFWQLGESHYWGHNAIIRLAPFMQHCALARLPGKGSLSGEILSHDFVEAALMRRAGWAVWIAYELSGSYEEMPPNLIDELKRDRRWCQGNLINSRLFFSQGLHPAHRAVFVTGVMAYVSAPLWFASLVLSTILLAIHTLTTPQYFPTPNQLFPLWPQWHPERAIGLFGATALFLFMPKILSAFLIAIQGAREYGGTLRLAASTFIELVFSALLAPIRMLFHTEFVTTSLLGIKVPWKSPPRDDAETSWHEAVRRHGVHTVIGLVWAGIVYWLNPSFLWWLAPVAGALALSIPISVYSSRVTLGRRAREARLFLIPEESRPPRVLRRMNRYARAAGPASGFVDAIVDPLQNALACASDVARTQHSDAVERAHATLVERAVADGPAGLARAEKIALLRDVSALSRLHFAVWSREDANPEWFAGASAPNFRRIERRHAQRAGTTAATRVASVGASP